MVIVNRHLIQTVGTNYYIIALLGEGGRSQAQSKRHILHLSQQRRGNGIKNMRYPGTMFWRTVGVNAHVPTAHGLFQKSNRFTSRITSRRILLDEVKRWMGKEESTH